MADLILPAPAKLNLFLHITGRRDDGYHLLQTLFQFVDQADELTFTTSRAAGIDFTCSTQALAGTDNLVVRAANLLRERYAPNAGANIHLEKRLPHGGGLGGGSSDAATTLLALRQLWQLDISDRQLQQLGLQLGADVPVFLGGQAAFAEGVGEQLRPTRPPTAWYLIVHPGIAVATADIFRHPDLPRQHQPLKLDDWNWENTRNDCELLVRRLYPEVANALDWLVEYAPARLTGTGACIFGRFSSQQKAHAALQQMPDRWTGFVAQGINESPVCQLLRQASTVNLTNQD
ncbi:kinase [Pseudidiomarina salinarum]|uniref:4-diphosphocytidyl-2-C-methyl-D-erythritol kinase n=1 Tax=Pseudidiomarina salinarum TaxID=435908 RepID=A0A094IWS4_9GAMM|nr:4-(cytidine 5'-diphospho)-2-C-methyl-D-erythritol kinase [Pseudidiomarina salinarum]KFZ31572.1 kinase [Pseudidiomarina salinarum]RUO70662.1 4-(cytidine 5'-diphospho)-2-C-methyl-D-erythritol kinase [Pseudidiomarina salinarum]